MTYKRFSNDQRSEFEEYKKTPEYQDTLYRYILKKGDKKRTVRNSKDLEHLATVFVDGHPDIFPEVPRGTKIKKIARRIRDHFESVVNGIMASPKKAAEPAEKNVASVTDVTVSDEKPVPEVPAEENRPSEDNEREIVPDAYAEFLKDILAKKERLCIAVEGIAASMANINSTLRDALFVKCGDLVDRDTRKPKHVGWPWLHSIQSELAQIRGLSACLKPRKDDMQEQRAPAASADSGGRVLTSDRACPGQPSGMDPEECRVVMTIPDGTSGNEENA